MSYYPLSVRKAIKNLSRFPGIGEKSAERLAMFILRMPKKEVEILARSIYDLKDKVRFCKMCFALSDDEVCTICNDPSRNQELLCVVEQPADMVSIEKSGAFKGLYLILQGALSPMDGIGPDDIRIRELMARIEPGDIKEVILATNTNVEGEATASYLAERLEKYSVDISRIASGVPIGGDLKYVDQNTLKRAMDFRHAVK